MTSQDMSDFIQILKINYEKNKPLLLNKYSFNGSNFIIDESLEQFNNIKIIYPFCLQ